MSPIDQLILRVGEHRDLPFLVEMLADDLLGRQRELVSDPLPREYEHAFAFIEADPNNELLVGELDGHAIAMLQLTYLPGLSYRGAWRAQIESVRVATQWRSLGVGARLCAFAIERARARRCLLVQLSTNAQRHEAHRFYERLGFVPSHIGMKYPLRDGA